MRLRFYAPFPLHTTHTPHTHTHTCTHTCTHTRTHTHTHPHTCRVPMTTTISTHMRPLLEWLNMPSTGASEWLWNLTLQYATYVDGWMICSIQYLLTKQSWGVEISFSHTGTYSVLGQRSARLADWVLLWWKANWVGSHAQAMYESHSHDPIPIVPFHLQNYGSMLIRVLILALHLNI